MLTRGNKFRFPDFQHHSDVTLVWVEFMRRTDPQLPWLCMGKFYTTMTMLGRGTDAERFHVEGANFTFPYPEEVEPAGVLQWGNYQAHIYHALHAAGDGWSGLNADIATAIGGQDTIWVMRGPSGVGKTTFIRNVLGVLGPTVLSMDHYHYIGRDYDFRLDNIGPSVDYTQRALLYLAAVGESPQIVLDKTCSRYWEYGLEVALAEDYGYKCVIVQLGSPQEWDARRLFVRNTHNVEEHIIRRMIDRWQPDTQHILPMDSWPNLMEVT